VTGSSKVVSPGFTKLKPRNRAQARVKEETGEGHKGIVRHTSFHHKSSSLDMSLSADGSEEQHNHSSPATDPKKHSRYREAVGTTGFRRSNKSFYKELKN
jgi:hypothetical protein